MNPSFPAVCDRDPNPTRYEITSFIRVGNPWSSLHSKNCFQAEKPRLDERINQYNVSLAEKYPQLKNDLDWRSYTKKITFDDMPKISSEVNELGIKIIQCSPELIPKLIEKGFRFDSLALYATARFSSEYEREVADNLKQEISTEESEHAIHCGHNDSTIDLLDEIKKNPPKPSGKGMPKPCPPVFSPGYNLTTY